MDPMDTSFLKMPKYADPHKRDSTVVLRKTTKKPTGAHSLEKAKKEGRVAVERRKTHAVADTDEPPPKVTHDFKMALMKARTAKGMKQADLAKRLNLKQTDIQDYESGKRVPEHQVRNKMIRVLGPLPKAIKK